MATAKWSLRAKQEFRELITYLKLHNRSSAVEAADDLKSISRLLARRPLLGRPGQRDGEREFTVSRWNKVFVYRAAADGIEISTLRDPRMQPQSDDTDA